MSQPNYLQQVRDQYENYPYPYMDPQLEKQRLHVTFCDALDRLNYYCFAGKRDFFASGFRALVAGGGTGNAAIALAEQLRDGEGHVTYLDMSQASSDIAKERARIRGLTNITWIQDSLLNIPQLDLGTFDYINCSGVLHHLSDPDAGLKVLAGALKDDGAMGLMVYATYGRVAVYQLQHALRLLNGDEPNLQTRVDNAKTVLSSLSREHWFALSPPDITQEVRNDPGVYDLLLHSQDRSYTVPELYDFIEKPGLRIVQLVSGHSSLGNHLYDPAAYLKDPTLIAQARQLSPRDQHTLAELLHGKITRHTCYAAKTLPPRPDPMNLDNIPLLGFNIHPAQEAVANMIRDAGDTVTLQEKSLGIVMRFARQPHMDAIFRRIDGNTSLKEIFRQVMEEKPQTTEEALSREFAALFSAMLPYHWLFLRAPGSAAITYPEALSARVKQMYPNG